MRNNVKMTQSHGGLKTLALGLKVLVFGFIFVGCSRPNQEIKKTDAVSIAIPSNALNLTNALSGKLSIASLANSELMHASINVSGAGIPGLIDFTWESCKNCFGTLPPPPSSFTLNIPSGPARLFQVLAVYNDNSTNQTVFYYGDRVADLEGGEVILNVPMTQLNSETGNPITDGRVTGRYLHTAATGPTGKVAIHFVPMNGKPKMLVGREEIIAGWFNFFMLSGAKFTYTVENTGEVLWGGPVSIDSPQIEPANASAAQRLRMFFPVHKRYDMGTMVYAEEDAKTLTWGYYGTAAITTTKFVCSYATPTALNNLYKYVVSAPPPLTKDRGTPPTYLALTNTTTPLPSFYVFGGGGNDMSSMCGTFSDTLPNLFENFIKVQPMMYDGSGNDQAGGFRGPFKLNATNSAVTISDNAGFKVITADVMPGVEAVYSGFQVFKRLNTAATNAYIEFPKCRDIASGQMGFVPASSITNITAGSNVITINTTISLSDATNGASAIVCPVYAGTSLLAEEGGFYIDPRQFGYGVNLGNLMINSAPQATNEYCYAMSINRTGSVANPAVVSLSSNLSPGQAKFYLTNSDCLSDVNALSVHEVTIPGGSSQITAYFRSVIPALAMTYAATINATTPSYSPTAKSFSIFQKVTSASFILGGPTAFDTATCQQLTFEFQNSIPSPQLETVSRTIIFQASGLSLNFYADNTCTTMLGSAPYNHSTGPNQMTAIVYFKAQSTGAGTIMATSPAPTGTGGNAAISLNPTNISVTVSNPP